MSITREAVKHSFWALPVDEVFEILQTSGAGLDESEILKRRKIFGLNELADDGAKSRLGIFAAQFKSPLIFILLAAGAVILTLGKYIDALFIFSAALINSALGFYQENKADEALGRLKNYIRETAVVSRSGRQMEIDRRDVAVGDILHFSQGDRIAADARVVFANNVSVDQSFLTGESLPVEKKSAAASFQADLINQSSMVFSGSLVVEGVGFAVVIAIGKDSQLGRIADILAKTKKEKTPLQKQIASFSANVSLILLALTAGVFLLGWYFGKPLFEMFLTSVAIAVAALPEGLPIALTVILAVGVERLAKKNGVVRKLLAAETLGNTTVILTDKTGTLTEARISLSEIIVEPLKSGADNLLKSYFNRLEKEILELAVLNSHILIENPDEPVSLWRISGRSVEKAVVLGAAEAGVAVVKIKSEIIDFLPFNSEHQYAGVLFKKNNKHFVLGIMGAPERILGMSGFFHNNGRLEKIGKKEKVLLEEFIAKKAFDGGRVLAVAGRDFDSLPHNGFQELKNLNQMSLLGFLVLRDQIRPGVAAVIKQAEEAGIKTVIVTGDHRGTAEALAKQIGWTIDETSVIDGARLDEISKDDLIKILPLVKIFSRVTPEGKLKLVQIYQAYGELVAMVGDGVNDAPALKTADIGVALGSGTDVARESADIILLDDNFETLTSAIEEGRRIIENIKKVVVFLFSSVFDELILIGASIAAGLPLPLNALQILWVNFFSDSLPATALSFENGFTDLLKKPVKDKNPIFDSAVKFYILVIGVFTSSLNYFFYVWFLAQGVDAEIVKTFIFFSFGTYTLFLTLSVRSLKKQIWEYNPFSNFYLLAAITMGIILMLLAVYLPLLQNIFKTVSLSWQWLAASLGLGLFNIMALESGKWFYRNRE